ncbi:MAG: glycosyltransferase family 2 protein [Bacteroidia bacterium]|nr:glycosyltransferase family 2 protein [Bacteroidia bacterium]
MLKQSKPFFSIIIPTYNRAGRIRQTLESIRAQHYDAFETIVVDDGSTDHTAEVLAPYIDQGSDTIVRKMPNGELPAIPGFGWPRETMSAFWIRMTACTPITFRKPVS